jgi:hypothetical protein
MNLDGGGSSTMVVNGAVKNVPSDGSERAVASGMMMINLSAKLQATTFNSGDQIKTAGSAALRLGPGSQYASVASLPSNTQGTVLDHSLRGIYAKGSYWWKCSFSGTSGWVLQNSLGLVSSGNLPVFTTHPTSQQLCGGTSTSFGVAASGAGPLAYRWQRDGIDLADGGHVSGSATALLSISSIDSTDEGSYRCVVTGANGSTTSYSAGLRMRLPTVVTLQPVDQTVRPLSASTSASFSIAATGESAVVYQWQRNGQPIANDPHYVGATTSSLSATGVDSTLAGAYRCIVTSTCGSAVTNDAQLIVLSADFDGDGDADQGDFGIFQPCIGSSLLQQTGSSCVRMDLNDDNRVDGADVTAFLGCMKGAGVPMPPGC